MLDSRLANKLLYVPYSRDYNVSSKIKDLLNSEEFFCKCYYKPDFQELISSLQNMADEECFELDYPIMRSELINRFERHKHDQDNLLYWIINNGIGVYAVTGEAGTGKTCYLKNMAYSMKEYSWHFMDMAQAIDEIDIAGKRIKFPLFSTLIGKCISVLLQEIRKILISSSIDDHNYADRVKTILQAYNNSDYSYVDHSQEIINLLNNLQAINKETDSQTVEYIAKKSLLSFSDEVFTLEEIETIFTILLEMFQYIQFLLCPSCKHIIVFDNIERYIGTDEIYDNQVIDFMRILRNYTDRYNNLIGELYAKTFQFIVALRDTTLRMFTPQQIADFMPHKIDLSEWFPIDKIINLKRNWYETHPELLSESEKTTLARLTVILDDKGKTGEIMRGLRLKLSMLFNNNKRLLLDFVIPLLEKEENKELLYKADNYLRDESIPVSYRKFSFRSIVWRIVCDNLRADALFQSIRDSSKENSFQGSLSALNYIRRILTILSNYNILHPGTSMAFYDMLRQLYNTEDNIEKWLYDTQRESERRKIGYVLYLLSYCNRHDNHWFRFVNISCRNEEINKNHIVQPQDFEKQVLKEEITKDLYLQITSGGIAYLGFIVQSFEQYSSFFYQYPPLLSVVPSNDDLMNNQAEELLCYKIVKDVCLTDGKIIRKINKECEKNPEIRYLKGSGSDGILYIDRIKNAHNGYIGNFRNIMEKKYMNCSPEIVQKVKELNRKLKILLKWNIPQV